MMIHLNGELLAAAEARIDPADRGLTLGDGLFETILARDARPLRLDAHLRRLRRGAGILGLPLAFSDKSLEDSLLETLKSNSLSEGVLRLTLTRGPAPRGLAPPADPRPTLLITAHQKTGAGGAPLNAVIATVTRRNEHSPLCRCKCLNRLDDVLARKEAAARGAGEAILLNAQGRVAEAAAANLFLVVNGALTTPPVSEGALPGVMRAEIMKTANVAERPLEPEEFFNAAEAFLTNSLGLRPLVSVDGNPIGDGRPGPLFESLLKIV